MVTLGEPYSVRSEERRRASRRKGRRKGRRRGARRGRTPTAEKLADVERWEAVYPAGVAKEACRLSHRRGVWRFEGGRAVRVGYEIYRGPKNQYGRIEGVLGRSEYGIEIALSVAYLVYVMGLSLDRTCEVLRFFQGLRLGKSQAESLLKHLARDWSEEFDWLCELLTYSAIVHADETSWSLKNVWAFLSENVRLLFFGVGKDRQTLNAILSPERFRGLLISDDARVYDRFEHLQRCWAHLLRKAIALTLQSPDEERYRDLLEGLLAIYRRACRVQRDRRFSPAGRERKVGELEEAVLSLCARHWVEELPEEGPERAYGLLVREIWRLATNKQLFQFVTTEAVPTPKGELMTASGTNNEAERSLRSVAQARKTGRTNKTVTGARRRTVIVSVLESLRQYLETFTFETLLAEVRRWLATGRSCFAELAERLGVPAPRHCVLDVLLPGPSP